MTSLDTNVLFYAFNESSQQHQAALEFVESLADRSDVAISELVLVELYRLVRNPAVVARPLRAEDAVAFIAAYRRHPSWKIIGFPEAGSVGFHDKMWRQAGKTPFAYRRIYDLRLALTLMANGVTEFATANVKDFEETGFRRVWNPLLK